MQIPGNGDSENGAIRTKGIGRRTTWTCFVMVITMLLTMMLVFSPTASADVTVPSWPSMSVEGKLSAVDLWWDPPDSDGGSPLTSYNLYRGTTSTTLLLIKSFGPTVLMYTDTDVVNGVYYYYALGAENAIGEGERAGPTLGIPGDEPGPPREFSGYAAGDLVFMTWQPPEYYGGCDITHYIVYTGQSHEGGTLYPIAVTDANVTSHSFDWTDHFYAGTAVFFKLMAYNNFGSGPFSNGIFITMPNEATAPGSPKNVDAIPGTLNVTLTWDPPDSDGGSAITGYEIMRGTSPGSGSLLVELGPVTQYVDESVQAGNTYYYSVRALNAKGSSPTTVEVSVEVAASAPSAPVSLTATSGNGEVQLSWAAPTNDGGQDITGYNIYRRTSSGSFVLIATVNDTTYTDDDVTNGLQYIYAVSAVSSVGESVLTADLAATPEEPSSDDGGDMTMIIIIAAVAIIAIVGVIFLMRRRK